jgi:putative 4-mercaptohistidine N1-methyltranferase
LSGTGSKLEARNLELQTPNSELRVSYYETDRGLAEYLLLHFGAPDEQLPYSFGPASALDFPVRCVRECLDPARLPPQSRALDLGCAVGRAAFELARHCAQVVAIDYSHRFIAAARHLQEHGTIEFACPEEGDLARRVTARVPGGIDRARVAFEQGDAQRLRPDLGSFDVILMANLIDRLRAPRLCLEQLPDLLKPGGQLILTSPYTWLAEFTPRESWLGGFERDGRRVKTLDTLQDILSPHFDLAACKDLPFLIREHARKFQWGVAEASLWIAHEPARAAEPRL